MRSKWYWLSVLTIIVAGALVAYILRPAPLPARDLRQHAAALDWSEGQPWSKGFHYWLSEQDLLVQGRQAVERVDARSGSRKDLPTLQPLATGGTRAIGELKPNAAEGIALWTPLRGGVGFAWLDGSRLDERPCTRSQRCGYVWIDRETWLEFLPPPGGGPVTEGFLHSLRGSEKPKPIALPKVERALLESAVPRSDGTLLLAADVGEKRACVAILDLSKEKPTLRAVKQGDMADAPALLALPAPGGRRLAWAYAQPEPPAEGPLARGPRHRWTVHVLLDPLDGGKARPLGTYPLSADTPCCPGVRMRWLPDGKRMSFVCEGRLWIFEVPEKP